MSDDARTTITNTSAPDGYPISGLTYILVYKDSKPEIKTFLKWALTTGQKDAEPMDYAPLTPNIRKKALELVESIR
jgi:phosphate transport system substrate-binding protein